MYVEPPDGGMQMSKHVGVWIMNRDTVVIHALVISIVHLVIIIRIITDARYMY